MKRRAKVYEAYSWVDENQVLLDEHTAWFEVEHMQGFVLHKYGSWTCLTLILSHYQYEPPQKLLLAYDFLRRLV